MAISAEYVTGKNNRFEPPRQIGVGKSKILVGKTPVKIDFLSQSGILGIDTQFVENIQVLNDSDRKPTPLNARDTMQFLPIEGGDTLLCRVSSKKPHAIPRTLEITVKRGFEENDIVFTVGGKLIDELGIKYQGDDLTSERLLEAPFDPKIGLSYHGVSEAIRGFLGDRLILTTWGQYQKDLSESDSHTPLEKKLANTFFYRDVSLQVTGKKA